MSIREHEELTPTFLVMGPDRYHLPNQVRHNNLMSSTTEKIVQEVLLVIRIVTFSGPGH